MEVKDFARPSREMIEEFKKYSTPNISDALDRFGIKGGCEGIKPVVMGAKLVGPALTVYHLPVDPVNPAKGGDYMAYAKPGDVIVIDNGGRTYCTVWGDVLTRVAMGNNLAGTVIDGCCRDVDDIRALNYPLFSRDIFMMTRKERTQIEAVNVPIAVRNVRVNPGDIVVGDGSGVVIVPIAKAHEVLKATREICEKEDLLIGAMERGVDEEGKRVNFTEARDKYGYWDLTRKK